jgi:hypothetical protein
MKTIMIIAFLGLSIVQVNAQKMKESDIPSVVKAAFKKAYPSAREVKWSKEEELYEVEFENAKTEISVLLDLTGEVKEVETEIKKSELPAAVQESIKKDYSGYKIEEAARIVSDGITTYEAEVEKGEKSFDLIFNANGKLVKKIEKKEKEDKD